MVFQLAEDWDKRIRQCITSLLPHLESGLKHEVDPRDVSVYTGMTGTSNMGAFFDGLWGLGPRTDTSPCQICGYRHL